MYTYKQFTQAVDDYLFKKIGLSKDDLADCRWYDLYEETFQETGELNEDALIETILEFNPETEELFR